ncbi:Rieske 2Fe-2S domain-containing protein [Vulcanococcus limneticus]|uniref:aromatic ring-hydroxylating dioxygenase subunit alpha n=1 Tax=Vulcanococcus limneticus TaxID=2170428 RepID=UPI00398C1019
MNEALRNFWYAVEHSAALATTPRQVALLGDTYILYRDGSGAPQASLDRCPHRGASFKMGWVESGCLRCPYHGWSFDSQGRCIRIPADQPGVPIPARARLHMLPAVESSGFLWIFPGDPAKADPSLIPSFPELGSPGWRAVSGEYLWQANFSRVVESGLDTSHAPFVHKPFFVNRDDAAVLPYEVAEESGSVSCLVKTKPPQRLGLLKYIVKRDRDYSSSRLTGYFPNVNRIAIDFNWKGYQYIYFASNIPINDRQTLTKWIGVRNFLPQPWADGNSIKNTVDTYLEDQAVVETQEKSFSWERGQRDMLLSSDQLILAYRKRMAALLASA